MRSPWRVNAQLSDAFVDGQPISWPAAIDGAATPAERASIEQFRAIDHLRTRASPHLRRSAAARRAVGTWLTRLACAQLAIMAAAAAVLAIEADASHLVPVPQLLMSTAFFASAAVLASAETAVVSVQALMNVYLICTVAFMKPVFYPLARTAAASWLAVPLAIPSALAPESFLAAELWTFALYFPTVTRLTRFDRIGRTIASALWALGLALFAANLVARVPAFAGIAWLQVLRREHRAGVFWFLLTLPMFAALGAIAWRTTLANAEERRRVSRFVLALAAGAGPFLLLSVALLSWPPFNRWFAGASHPQRTPIDVVVLVGLAFAPLGTAMAVVKDRALDVRIVVQRITRYALAKRLLALFTAAPLFGLVVLLYQRRELRLEELVSGTRGRLLLSWASAAAVLLISRRRLLAFLDRRFGLHAADHRAKFQGALDRARDARGFRELVFSVSRELTQALDPELASVLRLDSPSCTVLAGDAVSWRRGCGIEEIVRQTGDCIDVSPRSSLFQLFPAEERSWLATERIAAVAPVRRRDGKVLAVVALGPKRSGMPITRDDRWLIASLAALLALAWPAAGAEASEGIEALTEAKSDDVAFECPRCQRVAAAAPLKCGCAVAAHPAALPLVLNGKFNLVRCLGRGGMGVVYLARDVELGRMVAVKTLPAASADTIAELRLEARAMAALSHPALASIHGVEVWRDTPALVVEYCPGGSLAARLQRGRLDAHDAFELGRTLLHALRYMHERGVAHRDIKPGNIGFTAEGRPKLLDFGISTVADASAAESELHEGGETGSLMGTASYLPPESFLGRGSDVDRDLWGVALVMFEAIAGEHPYAGSSIAAIQRALRLGPPDLRRWLPDADPAAVAFFLRALAADPVRRYRSASGQLAALPLVAPEAKRM